MDQRLACLHPSLIVNAQRDAIRRVRAKCVDRFGNTRKHVNQPFGVGEIAHGRSGSRVPVARAASICVAHSSASSGVMVPDRSVQVSERRIGVISGPEVIGAAGNIILHPIRLDNDERSVRLIALSGEFVAFQHFNLYRALPSSFARFMPDCVPGKAAPANRRLRGSDSCGVIWHGICVQIGEIPTGCDRRMPCNLLHHLQLPAFTVSHGAVHAIL